MTSRNHIEPPMFGVAVDDRIDFCRDLIGSPNNPTAAQREEAASLKGVVFDGLLKGIESGIPKSRSWLWADVDLGEGAHLRARAMALPSGAVIRPPITSPSMLAYVDGNIASASRLGASAVLLSTTYNPEANPKFRKARQKMLRRIAVQCANSGLGLFLELMPGLALSRRANTRTGATGEQTTMYLVEGMRPTPGCQRGRVGLGGRSSRRSQGHRRHSRTGRSGRQKRRIGDVQGVEQREVYLQPGVGQPNRSPGRQAGGAVARHRRRHGRARRFCLPVETAQEQFTGPRDCSEPDRSVTMQDLGLLRSRLPAL